MPGQGNFEAAKRREQALRRHTTRTEILVAGKSHGF
jgi:hypothetical protein